jgi:hypothetical protein
VQVGDKADGHRKFVLGGRVLPSVRFDQAFKLEPVLAFTSVGRVEQSVHLESLADGT